MKKAFTLIEVLIVIILLGILAAMVVPRFQTASDDAREKVAERIEIIINKQLQAYQLRVGTFPPDLASVESVLVNEYIDEWPVGYTIDYHAPSGRVTITP